MLYKMEEGIQRKHSHYLLLGPGKDIATFIDFPKL